MACPFLMVVERAFERLFLKSTGVSWALVIQIGKSGRSGLVCTRSGHRNLHSGSLPASKRSEIYNGFDEDLGLPASSISIPACSNDRVIVGVGMVRIVR